MYPARAAQLHQSRPSQFAALFSAGGGNYSIQDDVQEQRWIKLGTNVA
jgi:hypothetical protein